MKKNSDKPHYLNHRQRLKDRFIQAPHIMHDSEIIELLLGYVIRRKDVKPQAKEILLEAKKLSNIFEANLKSVKGIGAETTTFFRIMQEFISRVEYQELENTKLDLGQPDKVYKFLKYKIGNNSKESFVILFLDAKNRLTSYKVVREGLINSVSISGREIIEYAIEHHALGVIIAHNHPSGDATPSESDLKLTKQICHALLYTGITLVDHLVVSNYTYYSMRAEGHINQFYSEVRLI